MSDAEGDRPKIIQVGEGFYVRQAVDNIAWIDLGEELLVVDALEQPELEAEVFAAIESTCPGKAVRHVLNTHTHYDHVALNAAFVRRFGAQIINQELTPLGPDGRWFEGSRRKAHMLPMPGCHTAEDCIVLVGPADVHEDVARASRPCVPRASCPRSPSVLEKPRGRDARETQGQAQRAPCGDALATDEALFVGDIFGWGCIPLIVNLRADTLRTLEETYARLIGTGVKTVVPGHGPLCTTAELGRWIDYLHGLIEQVKALREAGKDEAQIASAILPPEDMRPWWRFLKWKHADCVAKVLKAVRNNWV